MSSHKQQLSTWEVNKEGKLIDHFVDEEIKTIKTIIHEGDIHCQYKTTNHTIETIDYKKRKP